MDSMRTCWCFWNLEIVQGSPALKLRWHVGKDRPTMADPPWERALRIVC